jgi:hypothetical protein
MTRDAVERLLLRAWLTTALVDGLFASALSVFGYHSTISRLWQGVASTVLGPSAFDGGATTALVGVAMHIGVAFAWSAVFVWLAIASPALRRALRHPGGVIAVAAVYGPSIWMVMSLAVIPLLTARPPRVTGRWWIQLAGHIVFVALPMVTVVARGLARSAGFSRGPETAVQG